MPAPKPWPLKIGYDWRNLSADTARAKITAPMRRRLQVHSKGFTIVELLVVIAIIGILAAIITIIYTDTTQRARDAAVLSDAEVVAGEVVRYGVQHDGEYGSAVEWYSGGSANANIEFTPSGDNVVDIVANEDDYCIRVYNTQSATYVSLQTAFKKGSSATSCNSLPPSSGALADSPFVNGGVVSLLAGSGSSGNSNGNGAAASFSSPFDVIAASDGTVYVADYVYDRIRKITPAGDVTTFAGGTGGYLDGSGTSARFSDPYGLGIDAAGNIYVADRGNNRIRKITPAGVVTTLAGSTSGYTDATGTSAQFRTPLDVAVDSAGNAYVADSLNHSIRKITPAGVVTTFAGSGSAGYNDANGASAQFNGPRGVAVDASGNVYVSDTGNGRIRKITPTRDVTTFAGSGFSGTTDGPGSSARFNYPEGLAVDAAGNLYVADRQNHRIRKITPEGEVSTFAGSTSGYTNGIGTAAQFNLPSGIAIDGTGVIYVADTSNQRIRKIE